MKPLKLSTKRLTLRCAKANDETALFDNYFSDSLSSEYLTRKPHTHINQTKNFLDEWCRTPWEIESDKFAWVIALANTDEAIGVFLAQPDAHKVGIHYGIRRDLSNQGLITEAGNAVVRWLMNQSNIQRIEAVCDLSNHGSVKVLEKLGFQREGVLRKWLTFPSFNDSARDCYIYARVMTEHSSRSAEM